jgi:hypothetical protein
VHVRSNFRSDADDAELCRGPIGEGFQQEDQSNKLCRVIASWIAEINASVASVSLVDYARSSSVFAVSKIH